MRKYLILSLMAVSLVSCVKKEEVNALEKQILDIKKEIAQLKKSQSENTQNIQLLAQRLDELSNIVSKNSIEIEKLKAGYTPPANPPLEGEEKVKTPTNPKEVYNQALDFYYQGKLEEAQDLFEKFLKDFDKNELTDNAIFWIGQIYYSKGDYENAVKEFDKLVNLCEKGELPDCNKEPISMLKLSYSYIKLGEKEKAKEVLQKLIEKYPETEEALVAKRKLKELE